MFHTEVLELPALSSLLVVLVTTIVAPVMGLTLAALKYETLWPTNWVTRYSCSGSFTTCAPPGTGPKVTGKPPPAH